MIKRQKKPTRFFIQSSCYNYYYPLNIVLILDVVLQWKDGDFVLSGMQMILASS